MVVPVELAEHTLISSLQQLPAADWETNSCEAFSSFGPKILEWSKSYMLETNLTKGSHHILVQRFEYKKKLMLMLMLKLMLMSMLMLRFLI